MAQVERGRGDQFLKLKLVNPPKLSAKEKEHYQGLAAESRFDPRQLLPAR